MSGHGPKVHVYVDETGDRGSSVKSSPIFGMATIVLDEQGAVGTRAAVEQLRSDFKVPADKVMSWKDHVKTHDRRRHAAEVMVRVHGLRVCYVYAVKSELREGSYKDDRERFYNYVAYRAYKQGLWAARSWKGQGARVWTRFGHVRHHDHRTTDRYICAQAASDPKVPFHMEQGLHWVSADKYVESQAADLFGGFLKAALWPQGDFGYVEPSYRLKVWPRIRNSHDCAIPLGLMSMPENSLVMKNDWFPCRNCDKS